DWLPLPQILQDVARCPSRRKLLLVDVMQPLVLPTRGLLRSDVADRVWPVLEAAVEEDSHLAILCACSRGQVSWTSEELGHSVFPFFLHRGLQALADGCVPGTRADGRVTLRELVAYVRERVDHWTQHNLQERQTPCLLGDVKDFPLIAAS